ncbi:thiol-disulfide isomerase/thioredoxin [Naumannella cuiyingiana]|uniref:Thiol-disulfide isomerase/thioredoxin n=1 Tax=Naumannella cuiyingiana TaxID=1347891 RepID=A0A7Z0DA49_9ACTN|nr:TlpA disulfide reductase family protein [Naumannella cuiyingiana]NYI71503.1 thiol-disulfide isomerase/thioredoxin [Naumannella cuiyingiana]
MSAIVSRAAAFAVAAALLLVGCSSGSGTTGFVSAEPGLTRVPPGQREPAPVVSGTTLDGKPISTADYPGKIIVINVWGSWCAPCRKEAPELVEAAAATKDRAQFIGINTRDPAPQAALAFQRAFGLNYPSIFDGDGVAVVSFAGTLPPNGIPSTLVIDAEGRIAARVLGPTTKATLVGLIDDTAAGR